MPGGGQCVLLLVEQLPAYTGQPLCPKINRLKAIVVPKDIPRKQVYDKGTYEVNKNDDKAAVEKKGRGWQLLQPAKGAVLKNGHALAAHAETLYKLWDV